MNKEHLRVVRGPTLRSGIVTVVGVIPAETLVAHHFVPYRKVVSNEGYQRIPTESRISQLARELQQQNVDLPTSVLLNLRDCRADDILENIGNDNYLFQLNRDKASDEHRLFVVDGQHRIRALQKAIEEYEVDIRNIKLPFVCMIGGDEMHEMEQFHVVNSNAKSVRTDLALNLLKERAQSDPEFARLLEQRGRKWEVDAQALTERLAEASSTWKNRIRHPNTAIGETIVPSASFVRSLKPLLTQTALFKSIRDSEKQAQVIDAYWRAIRRILPEAFEQPKQYSIQKGVGVDVLHSVFPVVLDLARSEGGSLYDPNSYVVILNDALSKLEGLNGDGKSVQGVKFWQAGRHGAAGAYTSASGKRRLSEYLHTLLPELDI